jgi:hypothetical protein
MKTAERKLTASHALIDLTQTPYYAGVQADASQPVYQPMHAGDVVVIPDYSVDRRPSPSEPGVRYGGGLGLAAVLDVHAHPVRAQVRRINVLRVFAITVIAVVAALMFTFAALQY